MFEQVTVDREVFGTGENLLICGSVMKLPEEIRALAGKVQCVYVDPPFYDRGSSDAKQTLWHKRLENRQSDSKVPSL